MAGMSPGFACIRTTHSSQSDPHFLFRSAAGHVRTPENCCGSRHRPNTPEEDCSRLSKWRNRNLRHQSNRAAEDTAAVLQHQDARAGHPEDCQRKRNHWTVEGHHAISCELPNACRHWCSCSAPQSVTMKAILQSCSSTAFASCFAALLERCEHCGPTARHSLHSFAGPWRGVVAIPGHVLKKVMCCRSVALC